MTTRSSGLSLWFQKNLPSFLRPSSIAQHSILWVGVVIINLPIVYVICTLSFSGQDFASYGFQLGWGGRFVANMASILSVQGGFNGDITILAMLLNSLVTGFGFAAGTTLLSFLAAYALIYFRLPGRMILFALIMLTLFLPLEMRILPTYDVVVKLGLYDSYWGLVLPLIASPLALFFFTQYMRGIPDELVEAAILDGAGPIKFLRDILLPISLPKIITVFVITFVLGWNQYLWPLVITSDEAYFTLVRGMAFVGRTGLSGLGLALIAVIPPALLVIVFQKKLIRGLFDGIH